MSRSFQSLVFFLILSSAKAIPFRPSNIRIPLDAPDTSAVLYKNAFPNLDFSRPVLMVEAPDESERFFVVEQRGHIRVFPKLSSVNNFQTFADLTNVVSFGGEMGLLAMAFAPDYAQSGEFYVSYTVRRSNQAHPIRLVLARMRVSAENQNIADPQSLQIVLEIQKDFADYDNHNGGMIAFGPDGMLYMSVGDGGGGGDFHNNAQRLDNLWGKILRIDPRSQHPYAIPADNPFSGATQERGEIWAYGLRNPWRFSFDRELGTLWAADVGQSRREEINIIEKGRNYGWRIFEGPLLHNNPENIPFFHFYPPLWHYPQGPENSVTGGYVYRGTKIPNLRGRYIYGDYGSGRTWALNHSNGVGLNTQELGRVEQVSSFAEDKNGELYALSYSEGVVYSLLPNQNTQTTVLPDKLSATGLFADTPSLSPVEGLEEYPVISPLWSDNANKKRWMGLPANGKINYSKDGPWLFPMGTVFVKHFEFKDRKLETRVLFQHRQGWRGYTYKWNSEQSEAFLINDAIDEEISIRDEESGEIKLHTWHYPSRTECLSCHNFSSGQVLGVVTGQLNTDFDGENFLSRMNGQALFHINIGNPAQLPKYLSPHLTANDTPEIIRLRARSYLSVNCSHCHNPLGAGQGLMDYRFHVSDSEMNVIGRPASITSDELGALYRVDPGNPLNSVLYKRLETLNSALRMPPLATSVKDKDGLDLISKWIEGL